VRVSYIYYARLSIAVLLAFVLNACISKVNPLTIYTLKAPSSIQHIKNSKYRNSSLTVAYPKAIDNSESNHIFYQRGNQSGYYLYSEWSQPLNRLLLMTILETMEKSGLFKVVVDYSSTSQTDYLLETTIYSFIHNVNNGVSSAIVDLRINLIKQSSDKLIKSRHFIYHIPCEANAKGFVKAAQEAVNRLSRDLPHWLAQ